MQRRSAKPPAPASSRGRARQQRTARGRPAPLTIELRREPDPLQRYQRTLVEETALRALVRELVELRAESAAELAWQGLRLVDIAQALGLSVAGAHKLVQAGERLKAEQGD